MAKFCTKCGSPLEDGKCPKCKEVKSTTVEKVETVTNDDIVSNLVEVLKGTFTSPVETVKKYAISANFVLAIILMAICAVSAGIFTYVFVDTAMDAIGGLFGFGSMMSYGDVEIPFGKVFFRIFMYIAVYQIVVSAVMLLMNKVVFKEETDIKDTIAIVGITSVGMSCAFLVGAILFKIKFILGFVMAVAGMIFSIITLTAGSMETLSLKKDKMVYSVLASIAAGLFIILYVLPKLFN